MWNNLKIIWIYRLGLLLLIFLCLFVFLKLKPFWLPVLNVVKVIVGPFLIAYLIAFLLHPLVEGLHKRGMPKTIAILAIYVLFFGGIGLGIYKGFPTILAQLNEMNENYPMFAKMYEDSVASIQAKTEGMPVVLHQKIDAVIVDIEKWLQGLIDIMVSIAKKMVNYLILLIIIPFIVFYFLKDYNEIGALFWRIVPRKWHDESKELIQEVNRIIGGYIRGQLFVCLVLAGCSFLAFWIVGIPYPLLLGIIIGVTDIIPYFGPIIGAVPAILIASTVSTNMIITVIIVIVILQFVESNILGPYIVGKSIHMHPVLIMLALIVGGEIGGIVGMILAIPCLAIIKVIYIQTKGFRKQSE
ncbi:AI-2E family transporter [Priestia taiwanensis]|uniref:AI-2E family transporter n=1 Tax=Priestia taiwanensis TaxID=1347902 RepID=A0A917AUY0_9BACI|nr:AI-2E family transporter [Priestia taiwanensis]MBM7363682.1 putative PurR-regulated permease PerM [Priestia taiwanensis]GGE74974.1 AI-2E family transporter [Priestia taiwanensis]